MHFHPCRLTRRSRVSVDYLESNSSRLSTATLHLSEAFTNLILATTIASPYTIQHQLNMRTSRLQSLSLSSLRTSFRRSRSTSTGRSDVSINQDRYVYSSETSSPVSTINAIIHRQPSMVDMEEERNLFASSLEILEPRPIVYWGGLEERMGSL